MPINVRKKRGRATREEREAALRLFDQGVPIEQIHVRTGFKTKRIESWTKNRPKGVAIPPASNAPSVGSLGVEDPHKAGSAEQARIALGLVSPEEDATSAQSETRAPSSAPSTPGVKPPPTPEQLIALTKAIDSMVMKGICGTRFPGLPVAVVSEAAIPKADLDAMEELAPYAAEYAPLIQQYLGPVMALAFVGVWGMSVATRTKILYTIHRDMFPEKYLPKTKGVKTHASST